MTDRKAKGAWTIARRDFLRCSGLLLTQLPSAGPSLLADEPPGKIIVRLGLVTDTHYADKERVGSRYYRESLDKTAECVRLMNEKEVDFLVELGDFKDQAGSPTKEGTLEYLRAIEKAFGRFKGGRYHVLGNHDEDSISKAQFLANVENTNIPRGSRHYSFEVKGVRFVVLDANYRSDGQDYDSGNFNWRDANVPKAQLEWLQQDLAATTSPVIAFVHQQLDGKGGHTIKNASELRGILSKSGRVLAVFHGHNHAGGYSLIDGIHYYTLKAMVEGSGEQNSSYAIVEVAENLDISVIGYRKAVSKSLPRTASRQACRRFGDRRVSLPLTR